MSIRTQTKGRIGRSHRPKVVAAAAATFASLALLPAPSLASDNLSVAAGGTGIEVNGTTISTSNLTLGELANLQGVPPATVKLELDELASGIPGASTVEALIERLPIGTSLATALDELSAASGGVITPQVGLQRIVEDNGQPGASGAQGPAGANGSAGAPATSAASAPTRKAFTFSLTTRSLKGHPRTRVRVKFKVSSAATISYSGRGLPHGSRKVASGSGSLVIALPRVHGNYRLALKATSEGQTAQATAAVHDAKVKASRSRHR